MEKNGIKSLGYVYNLRPSKNNVNYISYLSSMANRPVSPEELDLFINSPEYIEVCFDEFGKTTNKENAVKFTFKTPYVTQYGEHIYGVFTRKTTSDAFKGVTWVLFDKSIHRIGKIAEDWRIQLNEVVSETLDINDINSIVDGGFEYLNGAGYTQLNGMPVTEKTAKFVRFRTKLKTKSGCILYGWFTKREKKDFEGLNWGTIDDFEISRQDRERFFIGRMAFNSKDDGQKFLDEVKKNAIGEEWSYKSIYSDLEHPILKSYLQFVLERLFYEYEKYQRTTKIIYNNDRSKILYNTNLIDVFGHDLFILGDRFIQGGKDYIDNIVVRPSKTELKRLGFDNCVPEPPQFFNDINEIVFHWQWDVDACSERYEHIIGGRKDRFPKKYQDLEDAVLGQRLDDAIDFAKKLAQRNYKFIVPMYYPEEKRIQLLMPIYLETSYSKQPDFALVLTPNSDVKTYTPETILSLDDAYQDARLIAKPAESWLSQLTK